MKVTKALAILLFLGVWIFLSVLNSSLVKTENQAKNLEAVVSGKDLFLKHCARCHGENGEGGEGPALNTEKKQAKWRESDKKLIEKISKGGFGMPKFRKKLKPEEIKAIADYVRTLKAPDKKE